MEISWLFWALLAASCWGLGPLFAKLGLVKSDPYGALLARTLGVLAILLFWGMVTSGWSSLQNFDARTWGLLVAEGIAASVIGHFAYFKALKVGKISAVVPVMASYPVLAMLLAVLLLGERVTPGRGIGAALIAIGVFLVQRF